MPARDTPRTSPPGDRWVLARRKRVRTPQKRRFRLKSFPLKNKKTIKNTTPPPTEGQRRGNEASRHAPGARRNAIETEQMKIDRNQFGQKMSIYVYTRKAASIGAQAGNKRRTLPASDTLLTRPCWRPLGPGRTKEGQDPPKNRVSSEIISRESKKLKPRPPRQPWGKGGGAKQAGKNQQPTEDVGKGGASQKARSRNPANSNQQK